MPDTDPPIIYLTPPCTKDMDMGRMWSEDGANDCECDPPCKTTRYIRADLVTHYIDPTAKP